MDRKTGITTRSTVAARLYQRLYVDARGLFPLRSGNPHSIPVVFNVKQNWLVLAAKYGFQIVYVRFYWNR